MIEDAGFVVQPGSFERYRAKDARVVYHDIPGKDGVTQHVKCVEYTVIGRRLEWAQWALYSEFTLVNPGVQIEEIEE